MVNPGKRMRRLQPILNVRNGPGAAILPPHPAPQITRLHLRYPQKSHPEKKRSAVTFWRQHLRQLKFHNPALPVTVEQFDGFTARLTIQLECEDRKLLEAIPKSVGHVYVPGKAFEKQQIPAEPSEDEKEVQARTQSPNWREAPSKEADTTAKAPLAESSEKPGMPVLMNRRTNDVLLSEEVEAEIEADLPGPEIDQVLPKPQAATSPSSPSSVEPSKTIFMRTVTLGMHGHSIDDVWLWFQKRTKCRAVLESKEDSEARQRLEQFFVQSEIDRQRVKTGVDAMKKEKDDLKRARGEAEKLQAETL